MTLRNLLLSSALSGSLALSPLALQAQDYDAWTLNREVLNAAANYTGVLTAAHGQVRKYITWQWSTSLTEDEQRQRTTELLREITSRQQITQALPAFGSLVPSLNMDGLGSFDVRFRWCDNRLLSYFASGFKHGLSAQQIVAAPVLRARRAGTTFNGEPLGIVESVDGELRLRRFGGRRSTPIPACMATNYGGALPEGTVAYMTSAAQKFGVARTRRRRETQTIACPAPQVGPGLKQQRTQSTDYNAQGDRLQNAQGAPGEYPYYDTNTADGDGHWRTRYSHCRTPATIGVRRVEACRAVPGASASLPADSVATYEYFFTEAYDPDFTGTGDFAKTVWLPSDRQGNFIPAPVGHLVQYLSFCGDQTPDSLTLVPVISHRTETRPGVCRAPYRLGSLTEAREVQIRRWSFADSPDVADFPALSEVVTEIEGPWAVSDDRCYRTVSTTTQEAKTLACPSGYSGTRAYRRRVTIKGTDWRDPKWRDQLTTTTSTWQQVDSTSCRVKPRGGGNGWGGGGGHEGGAESVDVDGDGRGDFSNSHESSRAGYGRGDSVPGSCGSCNGPKGGPTQGSRGGNGGGGGNKIVCTAMNAAYGFGRFRQTIWLEHSRAHMTRYHQTGYHLLALPLVKRAYGRDDRTARVIRSSLEHIARERTADIRAEQRDSKRRPAGRLYRQVLEPLCYLVGRLARGREVAGIADVAQIAATLKSGRAAPKHCKNNREEMI